MRIVIVGAGKLGYSIAELLSGEQNDVVVIDRDEARLEAAKNTLDVLTIAANGASPITMNDPDVRGSDILIAVTAQDEVNMMACILAKKHGIQHTAARIRDTEFLTGAKEYVKENFDIDLLLNPEYITAMEIFRILMTPSALNVEDFAEGKVRLFETKVKPDSPYANIALKDLTLPPSVLAGMIFRNHQMIIPHGDDKLLPMDNAYFIGKTENIEKFSEDLTKRDARQLSRAVIIGAGRTGRVLAARLAENGVRVKLIEKDRERCRTASERLAGVMVLYGDGTDIDLLTEEGVGEADAVICLTEDDKLNLMLALLAKHLGARETVVRVARSEYVDLMEKVGVDVALSERLLSASEVLAFVRRGGVVAVSLLEGAKAEAVEFIVGSGATVVGRPLKEISLPKECLICAFVRGNEAYIPNGDSVLEAGDRAILFIRTQHAKNVMPFFKGND